MRINPVNLNNYCYHTKINKINFTSNAISADDVALLTKMSRMGIQETDELINDTIKLKKDIKSDIKALQKEFKLARKNGFDDEYYPDGSLKRKYFYSKWIFRENLRAIDYTQSGLVKQIVIAEDGHILSLTRNRLPEEVSDIYELRKDDTFSQIILGKREEKAADLKILQKYDRKYIFDDRSILKRVEIDISEDTQEISTKRVFELDRYLKLNKLFINASTDRLLNINNYNYVFSYKDKKPSLLEINVEETTNILGLVDKDTRKVDRTIKYIN